MEGRTPISWPRLFVTLLALTCMLVRAVLPLPAMAESRASTLAVLGAALCHTDGDRPDQTPAEMPDCDHCPVCGVAIHVPPLTLTGIAEPPRPVFAALVHPAAINPLAPPRAPPEHAHNPRAPPAL